MQCNLSKAIKLSLRDKKVLRKITKCLPNVKILAKQMAESS